MASEVSSAVSCNLNVWIVNQGCSMWKRRIMLLKCGARELKSAGRTRGRCDMMPKDCQEWVGVWTDGETV